MKDYKNILIIKMSSLGDVIHALPTLYAVRKIGLMRILHGLFMNNLRVSYLVHHG